MTDWLHSIAGIIALCAALASPAHACGWQLKAGREPPQGAGIVCTPGQTEYQIATLNCEHAPLHLDLEGDCGADWATCRVRLAVDQRYFDLVGANNPVRQIWDGFIAISIADRGDLIGALATAQRIDVSVEDKPSWQMPTEGLARTLGMLAKSCAAKTS